MIKTDIINKMQALALAKNDVNILAEYTLNNLNLITNLTAEEFIKNASASRLLLNNFLLSLSLDDYSSLQGEIEKCLLTNNVINQKNPTSDKVLIQKFYKELLNSLELNYQTIMQQEDVLAKVVQKIKDANRIYFFTHKNSVKIIEDFAHNLISAGFKITTITNYITMNDLIHKMMTKDLIFFIFDDFKNKPLVNVAKQVQNVNNSIIVSKDSFHELNNLQGIKYLINYQNFLRIPSLDARKFSLMFLLNAIYQKIVATIVTNYQQINQNLIQETD